MISYAGGKYNQATWIGSFIPSNIDTYCELFGGAYWVYFRGGIHPKKAIYNDVNPYMHNLFACAKEYKKFLPYVECLKPQEPTIFDNCKKYVLDFDRSKNPINPPNYVLASNYVYVLTQSFSGMVSGSVAKAKLAPRKYGDAVLEVMPFVNTLRKQDMQKKLDRLTEVSNLSYEVAIGKYDSPDLFIYADPPYYGTENYYAFHDFTTKHHKKLADMLKGCKAKWMLSYYEFPDLKVWFPEDKYRWERKEFVKPTAAEKGGTVGKGMEVLILNYENENENVNTFFE